MAALTPKRPASHRARFNRVKFKALVHYICWRCEDPRLLGTVKLNKVLWYAERIWYFRTGQPIVGATYLKQQLRARSPRLSRHSLWSLRRTARSQPASGPTAAA